MNSKILCQILIIYTGCFNNNYKELECNKVFKNKLMNLSKWNILMKI